MHDDPPDTSGALDGSVEAVDRFLRDMTALADQKVNAVPVLELQIGEILAKTSVKTSAGCHYLLVTAFLPSCGQSYCWPGSSPTLGAQAASVGHTEFLWHADEGRYIAMNKIPISALHDERSLMDAILTTCDEADAWLSSVRSKKCNR